MEVDEAVEDLVVDEVVLKDNELAAVLDDVGGDVDDSLDIEKLLVELEDEDDVGANVDVLGIDELLAELLAVVKLSYSIGLFIINSFT